MRTAIEMSPVYSKISLSSMDISVLTISLPYSRFAADRHKYVRIDAYLGSGLDLVSKHENDNLPDVSRYSIIMPSLQVGKDS